MLYTREMGEPEEGAADGELAFVAFTLSHSGCGDGVIEVRLGDGSLLEWCVACGEIRTFGFPDA